MFNRKVLSGGPSGFWLRFFSLCLLLLLWSVVAAIADSSLLPGPWTVAVNMVVHLREGDLVYHTGITLARVAVAFGAHRIPCHNGPRGPLVMAAHRSLRLPPPVCSLLLPPPTAAA